MPRGRRVGQAEAEVGGRRQAVEHHLRRTADDHALVAVGIEDGADRLVVAGAGVVVAAVLAAGGYFLLGRSGDSGSANGNKQPGAAATDKDTKDANPAVPPNSSTTTAIAYTPPRRS